MPSARPPIWAKQIRHYLRMHGVYTHPSPSLAQEIFREHIDNYFQGFITTAFFTSLADEFLYQFFKHPDGVLDCGFVNALLAASALSSVSTNYAYRKKLETLRQFSSHPLIHPG
ncbi:hypothetical protein A2973_01520 [Candidatus Gottesmanbacteria bacterium RIFCSPLOWO2_01_FULL_49_10]|uniref:Uncharacterized protein n=1 Tax=Candidatus Gottesmanbacteria bacterium RIFCSPLOWO2_01_FULL_49_10 TaxID=1798396 RepID=A0A1F6B1A3_9BACT|nr:MAG: hypothetical protein A2973_01520 [Candidatus Gottesmanbacteria bacterium RIFCSPLOWO2_01_FULL_49_10]